ncbi:MAG TPA: glycosyltransferase family 1 protein [Candidatus Atribacteria bacterium]|nr:glycosyltransferase family 1 protein [Candidatus Atribacteria bacterium]
MHKKIKVAVIGSDNFLYTSKLVHYLSDIPRIDLHLITLVSKNEENKKGNIKVHNIKVLKPSNLTSLFRLPSIKHKIMKINPDIVHVIQQLDYSMVAASLQDRYPTLLTVVGIISREYKFSTNYRSIRGIYHHIYTSLIGKRIERYVISKIPSIIVESRYNRDIVSQMTHSKIYVVPNGIEFRIIQGIQPDLNRKVDIFSIGKLHPGKGIDLLIKAGSIVAKLIPNFSLAIAGKGWQEHALKDLVNKLHMQNRIKFLGFISEEEKFKYFKTCKIVVVPSRWDFSPITICEAMACGKPVVASTATNSEILKDGETGFLFESENIEDLVSKISTLLQNDELRRKMGQTAVETAKECDWSRIAKRTVEVYREVIADFHDRKAKDAQKRKRRL